MTLKLKYLGGLTDIPHAGTVKLEGKNHQLVITRSPSLTSDVIFTRTRTARLNLESLVAIQYGASEPVHLTGALVGAAVGTAIAGPVTGLLGAAMGAWGKPRNLTLIVQQGALQIPVLFEDVSPFQYTQLVQLLSLLS